MSITFSGGSSAAGPILPSTDQGRRDEIARAAPGDAGERSPVKWKVRALRAVTNGRPQEAWLWADALVRHLAGPARADALMLRSVTLALRGETGAAEDDLGKAAEIDPESPALNRALLNSGNAATRLGAATRLLRGNEDDRTAGIVALARNGVDCVGLIAQANNRLSGRLMWNGPRSISLLAKSDVHEQSIPLQGEAAQGAFKWSAKIDAALPHQARVVTPMVTKLKAVFEPASLLLSAAGPARPRSVAPRRDKLMIVVPAFDGREVTRACLDHLLSALPATPSCRVVVVDDASPDAALSADLDALAKEDRIALLRNRLNMGFAASVNRALENREAGEDVLLLNADTVVPPGAIAALAAHLRASPDIATVTPLSNNGEDTSFPARFNANPLPADIAELQDIAGRVNRGQAVDMPNGVGFCLYINSAAIDRLGGLSTAFDRGYYEDVEFCLRAKQAGLRNVCATDAYVGHHGGQSFGADKRALVVRNLRRLGGTQPDYVATARAFEKADPLKPAIARIEDELLRKPRQHLLLMPADAPPFLEHSIAHIVSRKHGNVLVIRAGERKGALQLAVAAADGGSPQNLIWRLPMQDGAELGKRLSQLHLDSATIVDAEALPPVLADAITKRTRDITLLAARVAPVKRAPKRKITMTLPKRPSEPATLALTPAIRHGFSASGNMRQMGTLDLAGLPHAQPPKLAASSGVLAVLGMSERDEDLALLRALGAALPSDAPRVIVAGRLGMRHRLPPSVHVSGTIGNDELSSWLTRLGAQAVLFADRKWGMADPRAALWLAAGLPVAWFGLRAANAPQDAALVLQSSAGPDLLAQKIAAWLAKPNS